MIFCTTYIANTEVGKIEPSESYIKKFKDSKLLIPGRHIQLMHTIGQGTYACICYWKNLFVVMFNNINHPIIMQKVYKPTRMKKVNMKPTKFPELSSL